MKKILFILVTMLLPLVAWADYSGECGSGLTYTFEDATGVLTISKTGEGTGEMTNWNVFNSTYAPWYNDRNIIKIVILEEGVTSIGEYAFYECSGLTTVTIPNSVTSIGECAFNDCSGLTSVTIPSSVTSIGEGAFGGCSGLTSLNIPNSVTSIDNFTFTGCSGLTTVTIPNSVTSIGEGAFNDCSGLTSATIPNSVTSIGEYAFYYCSCLTSVTIPNSVTSIGGSAFGYCSSMTSLAIPGSVKSIGDYAFGHCESLKSVIIPNTFVLFSDNIFNTINSDKPSISDNCLFSIIMIDENNIYLPNYIINKSKRFLDKDGNVITKIKLPEGITEINSSFSRCKDLTEITIPNSVTSIGEGAFYECSGLTSLTIPNSVTSIDNYAFYGCSGLTSVLITDLTAWCNMKFGFLYSNPLSYAHHLYLDGNEITNLVIPDGVTSIGDWAFLDCRGLTSVTIPNGVTSIGCSAFYGCSGLTSVTIPSSVTSIHGGAYYYVGGMTPIGGGAFFGTSIRQVKSYIKEPYSIEKSVFPDDTYRKGTLYVPEGTEKLYARFDGWREFLNIVEMGDNPDIPGAEKCATPTISIVNGKLYFSCETEGVEYKYTIEAADAKEGYGNGIKITNTYKVSVYAFKDGWNNSETAITEITAAEGDLNGDGVINAADVVKLTDLIIKQ